MEKFEPVFEATARMFAPNIGVNEDVINGNSSGCLGAYLFNLKNKNPLNLLVHQGQAFNREGTVKVRVKNVAGNVETAIGGTAKINGEITLAIDQLVRNDKIKVTAHHEH
jgi:PhzF family phenazine biosynthesis protein